MRMQPLDMNPQFNALLDAYGDGKAFGTEDVTRLLNINMSAARKVLVTIKNILQDCPDGIQLVAKRGSIKMGGGHRFMEVGA